MAPPSKPTTRASLGSNKDDDDGNKKPAASPTKPAPPSTSSKTTKKTSTTTKGKSSDKIPRKPAASPAKHQFGGAPSAALFQPSPPRRHGTGSAGATMLSASPFSFSSPGGATSSVSGFGGSAASSPGVMSASSASSTGNLANLFGGANGVDSAGGTTDLTAFGIVPAAPTNVNDNGDNKTCLLKCAVIRDGDCPAIYFYFQPANGRPEDSPGAWPEKVFVDKLRNRDPSVMQLNFDPHVKKLFLNNEPVKNSKNYTYRLVRIRLAAPVPNGNAKRLGQHICTLLNASPENDVTVIIVDDSFFLHEAGSTHSDVLGLEEGARDLLRSTTGQQPGPGFYEAHRGAIHSYFRAGQFSLELARALHAPLDEVHPNQRAALVPPAAAAAEQPDDGGENGGVEVETVLRDTDDEDGLDLSED